QWSQQVQRVSALLGQALAGLGGRSLQRGQRGVLERRERAGVSIVTSRAPVLMAINQLLKRMSDFYPPLQSGDLLLCAKYLFAAAELVGHGLHSSRGKVRHHMKATAR